MKTRGGRRRRRRFRKVKAKPRCRFTPKGESSPSHESLRPLDYKNLELLSRFITSQGKLWSRKRSGNSAQAQARLKAAVKRARFMALLPFAGD